MNYVEGLPESYGRYIFVTLDDVLAEGYYDSFPFPHHHNTVKFPNYDGDSFYYAEVKGYLGIDLYEIVNLLISE